MGLEVRPYTGEWEAAVKAFNERLGRGGVEFQFPETWQSDWLPRHADEPLYEEYFLATEGSDVHGAYALKHQRFRLKDETVSLAFLGLPLSEGIIDQRYKQVGLTLLTNALKRQPLLFCLGMGGLDNPLPVLLKALGWSLRAVPFFYTIVNAPAFLRNIAVLRRRAAVRIALDVAAATGAGSLGIGALNYVRRRQAPPVTGVTSTLVPEFGSWADAVWEAGAPRYALAAVRDRSVLDRLYPAHKPMYLRIRVTREDRDIGWAVALDAKLTAHRHFGDMRLGSIIDCFAVPGGEREVIHAATRLLRERGVDLIVSNQSHQAWCEAHARCGFSSGPSNYVFAASLKLAARLSSAERQSSLHFCRGDGEGPTGLE